MEGRNPGQASSPPSDFRDIDKSRFRDPKDVAQQGETQDKIKIGPKKKIGLVLSGGATKAGAFHIGVALALQEQGFRFLGGRTPQGGPTREPDPMEISVYVGSSAGSMISTFLAAGYSLENIFNSFLSRKASPDDDLTPKPLPPLSYQTMFRVNSEWAGEQLKSLLKIRSIVSDIMEGNIDSFLKFKWLKMKGLFSTAGLEQYLREDVLESNIFQDYAADLFIVGTQLNHSRKVVFGKNHYKPPPHDLSCQYINNAKISEACAASTALPFIYEPYAITHPSGDRYHYIDGEIRETLSTHVAVDAGSDLVIASHTHQPYHFKASLGSLTEHGLPAILVQSLYLVIEQKINRHLHTKRAQGKAFAEVSRYCKDNGVSEEHRKRILEILEAELFFRPDVDTIMIHPSPDDHRMFFNDHFTLSPRKLKEIAMSGFRAATETLKKYDFADRKREPAIGDVGVRAASG